MKKTFAIILAVLMLAMAFAACSEKTTGGTTGTGTGTGTGTSTGTGTGTSTGTGTGTGTSTTTPTETKKEPYGVFRNYFTSCPATACTFHDTNTPCSSLSSWGQASAYTDRPLEDSSGWYWICQLAADWPQKMDSEGKVWRMSFRQDLKWANGEKMDINDWIYSLQMISDPLQRNIAAPGVATASNHMTIVGLADYFNGLCTWDQVGVKKIDDYTVELTGTFGVPQVNVQRFCNSFMIVYKPYYEASLSADRTTSTYATSVESWMCCGPMKIVEWVPDAKWVFERNENFVLADDINLQGVTYIAAGNAATALQLFLSGELDYCTINYADWERFEDDPRVYEYWNDSLMYFFVNHGNPTNDNILGDLNYRKAIYYATDRKKIADTIGKGVVPATRFVRKSVIGNNLTGKAFVDYDVNYVKSYEESFNPALANQYLTKALEKRNMTGATAEILQSETSTYIKASNEMCQQTFKEVFGDDRLKITIRVVPSTVNLRRWNPDNPTSFELSVGSMLPSATDPRAGQKFFISSYSPPRTSWHSDVYDDLYEQAIVLDLYNEIEAEKIVDLCQQMEKILLDDLVIVPIFEIPTKVLYSDKIHLPVDHYIVGYGFGNNLMWMDK